MAFTQEFEALIEKGAKQGLTFAERRQFQEHLAAEASFRMQWDFRKMTKFVNEENMLPPQHVAGFVFALRRSDQPESEERPGVIDDMPKQESMADNNTETEESPQLSDYAAQWDADPKLQKEFPEKEAYIAYMQFEGAALERKRQELEESARQEEEIARRDFKAEWDNSEELQNEFPTRESYDSYMRWKGVTCRSQ